MLTTPQIDAHRARLAHVHTTTTYYEKAESTAWLSPFWSPTGLFRPLFDTLDLTNVIDLACGHGRHTAQFVERAGHVTLVDVNQANIDACKLRFASRPNVSFLVNDGRTLRPLPDGQFTSVFSYDAMVHFEAMDVASYVVDIFRVLAPLGRALLHYSVLEDTPHLSFDADRRWRNYGSESFMCYIASRAGFSIIAKHKFPWPVDSEESPCDGLILLEKPN